MLKNNTMETLYRKVSVSERMPEKIGTYMCMVGSRQLGNYDFLGDKFESSAVKYWFESFPNPTAQLKADKENLLEALGMSLQLNKAFGANSEWIEVQEIESLIQRHKK